MSGCFGALLELSSRDQGVWKGVRVPRITAAERELPSRCRRLAVPVGVGVVEGRVGRCQSVSVFHFTSILRQPRDNQGDRRV